MIESLDIYLIIIFFIMVAVVLHTYLFYPIILKAIASFVKESGVNNHEPKVSILISAFNEEEVLVNRINNLNNLDYDKSKLEVLIGSDASTDSTNKILSEYSQKHSWLKVFLFEERQGKAGVLNALVEKASNEILIFSDANTDFKKDCIKNLVKDFSNPEIGGVSGRLILTEKSEDKDESVEEVTYWEYETFTKNLEGKLGILIGANGGNFAIRKKHFRVIPIEKAVTDDFYISLSVLADGAKFAYAYNAIATEELYARVTSEFKRKVRFSSTNFQTIYFFKNLLFNRNPLLSYAFWSHKLLRWTLPFFLLLIFILNLLILNTHIIFFIPFITQIAFYLFALIGLVLSKYKIRISLFSLPFFFMVANIAVVTGFFKFLTNKHSVIWEPTKR